MSAATFGDPSAKWSGEDRAALEENLPLLTPGQDHAKTDQSDYDPEMAQHGGQCTGKFAVGQVTIRTPFQWDPLNVLAITFSFVPWFIPLFLLAFFACTLTITSLILLIHLVLSSLLNELALKPLVSQPRPEATANKDAEGNPLPGMPSGHVTISQTFGIWCIGIAALHFHPMTASIVILCLATMMVAVPWARWYNGDHSLQQVFATGALSTIIASTTFVIYYYSYAYENGLHKSFLA